MVSLTAELLSQSDAHRKLKWANVSAPPGRPVKQEDGTPEQQGKLGAAVTCCHLFTSVPPTALLVLQWLLLCWMTWRISVELPELMNCYRQDYSRRISRVDQSAFNSECGLFNLIEQMPSKVFMFHSQNKNSNLHISVLEMEDKLKLYRFIFTCISK